jgi:short-subunit dehydrogenase
MIIGITGHTKGIGKSLLDIFQKNNHEVIGYSRTNGFDIGDINTRKKIIEESLKFDIFINNAYDPQGQIYMLQEIIDSWKNTNKIIINISSQIVYKPSPNYSKEQQEYRNSKIKLNEIVNTHTGSIRIINVILDLTDTDFYLIPKEFDRSFFIKPITVADTIYNIIKHSDEFFIKEIRNGG